MADTKTRGGGEQNLSVCLRIRPMNEDEILYSSTCIAHKVEDRMVVLMDPMEDPEDILRANRSREKTFVFDACFDGSSTQEEVYESSTKFLIENVITGYNATVFAYGATGAGKTYTMLGTDDEPGIMARTLNDLFISMENTEDMKYKVTMSYLEIYNEMIKDLLNPSSGILDLREDSKGGIQVAGLSEVKARSTDEVMRLLMTGNKERTQEPTAANKTSSRSHAVLQVIVRQQNRVKNVMQEVRTGKLFLIDLAGSERAANTHNRGKRMVEGAHINRSLLALGNCINALTDKNGRGYVNYRDSKLTRLLKDALGGNCKTVMIAHISPSSIHYEESRNTLVYADRAKHIKTKVRRNVTDVAFHIAQYTNIIQELREEITRLRSKLTHPSQSGDRRSTIHTVQSEVLEAKRNADREELHKLKEQLLISFTDQMELRKSMMELNNATMEISLETNRNQMVISEWELEMAKAKRSENPRKSLGSIVEDTNKALEMAGLGTDEIVGAEEVKTAKEELKVLHEEKYRTEKIRATVKKELETARSKTRKLEETIPQRISSEDQKELLWLLCKVHELEISNTEVQSSCLLRDFQIKKKDMVISRYRQHQSLCDQIIHKQKNLMDENAVKLSGELEELIEVYKMEKRLQREDSDISLGSDLKINGLLEVDQLSTLTEETEPVVSRRRRQHDLRRANSDDNVFQTPRKLDNANTKFGGSSSRLNEPQSVSGAWRNHSNLSGEIDRLTPPPIPTIRATPPAPSRISNSDRHTILSNTRSIAALAAQKRNKAQTNLMNLERQSIGETRSLYRPSNDRRGTDDRDAYLTPSRLDKHNKKYNGDQPYTSLSKDLSDDSLSIVTKHTAISEHSLPPLRRVGENIDRNRNMRQWVPVDAKRKNKKVREPSYTHQFLKKNQGKHGKNRRLSDRINDDGYRPKNGNEKDLDTISTKRRKGQSLVPESSNSSTPMSNGKSKRPPATIPAYKKGDITITGFSLARN